MKKLKVGIATYKQYKDRTMEIARGAFKPAADDPKIWFTSIKSFARVLSDRNRELLALIAEKTGRAPSNLSCTLRTMELDGAAHARVGGTIIK
jgi:predicted transcriptional regulator